jgi:hypothetical protein
MQTASIGLALAGLGILADDQQPRLGRTSSLVKSSASRLD